MSLRDFSIIESTLREGEQFVNAFFTAQQKVDLALMLDDFGVECLELTSPLASPQSLADCRTIADLGLKAKVITHTRCSLEDARVVLDTGVDGIDIVIGTSSYLRQFSHGRTIAQIQELATQVVTFLLDHDLEVRFSTEDSLRSNRADLVRLYQAMDELGVDRVGVADTVGVGTPLEVFDLVRQLGQLVNCDIEFHGHNDSGCAIANSYAALEAGATHVDTSVLGIGERNGITPLGGLIARLYATDPDLVSKYKLTRLHGMDQTVAELIGVDIPFNNYITGFAAFTHKAGIHAKAVLNNPSTYEILRPEAFGMTRYISVAHRLTGWNALRHRADQLGLNLNEAQLKELTGHIKSMADERSLTLDEVDGVLRHRARVEGET